MNDNTYTQTLENMINLRIGEFDDCMEPEKMYKDITDSLFRDFHVGLDYFLKEYVGFEMDDSTDIKSKVDFIASRCKAISYTIDKQVIKGWYSTHPSNNVDSRQKMYALCFAFNFDVDRTKEFFRKVYFERCFDCHDMTEAVYYYCLKHGLPYTHAMDLIKQLPDLAQLNKSDTPKEVLYTNQIINRLDLIETDEELLSYFEINKNNFLDTKQSALKVYENLVSTIKGSEEDVKALKKGNYSSIQGLVIKELSKMEYHEEQNIREYDLLYKQFDSEEFMLSHILGIYSYSTTSKDEKKKALIKNPASIQITKASSLPALLRRSFPNKQVLNNLRNDFAHVSYDTLRKAIILLSFYKCWCEVTYCREEIGLPEDVEQEVLFEFAMDSINNDLMDSGYEALYPGNPYDWLFIFSSKSDDPLSTFRIIYEEAVKESNQKKKEIAEAKKKKS